MTLKPGQEIKVKVLGNVFTIRAVGKKGVVPGAIQIYGKYLNSKREIFVNWNGNKVAIGNSFGVGYNSVPEISNPSPSNIICDFGL